jgi:hypothetical protein
VQPREAAIQFWLDPIPPEEMPMLAAQMLAEGHDAPALRRAAGYSRRDDPRDIRQEFGQALEELGAWLPDCGAAELAAGMCLAHALLSGALTVVECSRRALGTWDFDDVIYPGLPGDLKDLVLMCHLLGTEHYAPNGGDERLLAAARALAARSR